MRAVLGAILAITLSSFLMAEEEASTSKFKGRSFIYYMKKLLEFDEPTKYRAEGVPFSMTWSNSQSSDRHILVGCILNGKELGCLPTIVDLFSDFKDGKLGSYQGRLTFFVANPHTAVALGSSDQNIAFGGSPDGTDLEVSRASELKKLVNEDVDLFIELNHRESQVMKSAYVFPYDELTLEWATFLGASDTLITPVEYNNKKKMTMAEYARSKGILSLRLDLFEKDKSEAALIDAYNTSRTMIERAISVRSRLDKMREIYDFTANALKLKKFYRTVYVQPFEKPSASLKESFTEFNTITEGEIVGTVEGTELKAPHTGLLLRPKYPKRDEKGHAKEPLPRYLYELIQEINIEELVN